MPAPIAAVALIGGLAVATSVPLVIGSALEPVATLVRQKVWPLMPVQKPDPNTLVIARLKGVIDDGAYKADMLVQGFSADAADTFLKAAEQILGPGELLGMVVRGIIGPDKMASELARLGVSEESASNLAQMAETLLDPNTLVQAKFRGGAGAGKFDSVMTQLGYTGDSAATFEEVSKIIGGPSDMIRWAVREVFTPEIVQELGLADEFPTEFVTEAAKIGMEENIASNEWKAHWILPSVQQGFEMLHRRAKKRDGSVFEIADMERLLRVQDVMPFFRELLTQIAYRPYTRVDVRRMHKMGILDRDGVHSAYLDLGFHGEKAEGMTDFTIQFNTESERDLTKTEIMRAFDRGVIDEESTLELLSDVGIPAEAAQIIIATQLAKASMDMTDELSDIEMDRYIDGLITEDELQDAFATLDLTASQIELLMAKSRRKRLRSRKMPTPASIIEWYNDDLIDDTRAHNLLDRHGYDEVFRNLMLGKKEKLSSRADILKWFERKLIDQARAIELLTRLGISPEVIGFLLDKPDRKPSQSDIKRWLMTHLITETVGREMLADLDFAPDLIDIYIQEAIEIPSRIDILNLYIDELITEIEALELLAAQGYSPEVSATLLAAPTKKPSRTDVKRWLIGRLITEAAARGMLADLRYAPDTIDLYIQEAIKVPTGVDVREWYHDGLITESRAVTLLGELDYAPDIIVTLLTKPAKKPTRTTIGQWLKVGSITEEAARDMLADLGHDPTLVNVYIKEMLGE